LLAGEFYDAVDLELQAEMALAHKCEVASGCVPTCDTGKS